MSRLRSLTLGVLALVLPVAVLSAYLLLSREVTALRSVRGDYLAIGVAVVVGMVPAWQLARRGPAAVIVMVGYALVAAIALTGYGLSFVCGVFDDCL